MHKQRLILCAPKAFSIRYEINPWMKLSRRADRALAFAEWKALKRTLESLGQNIRLVPPGSGLPDMVFTANAGIVSGKTFFPSNFRHVQRTGESPLFRRWFKKAGFKIRDLPSGLGFEGEGDLLEYEGRLFGGYPFRTDLAALRFLSRRLGRDVVTLRLVNSWFYHLDTCFCPLDDGAALFYPGAFDRGSIQKIRRWIRSPIPVARDEARRFVCNGFLLGKTFLAHDAGPRLRALLRRRGITVVEVPTGEFLKSGGSVKCMILRGFGSGV